MTEAKAQVLPVKQTNAATNAIEKAKKVNFSAIIKNETVQASLMGTLGDAMRTKTFTSALISAVNTNPQLRDCDGMTIISAALLGESLKLSPSPQLGQYYMVPFNTKVKKTDPQTGEPIEEQVKAATFQLGWKGYYQLAMRSGQYQLLDAVPIKEGELISYSSITGEIKLKEIEDPEEREKAKTIGYYAYFVLNNGFKKTMYWSKAKMIAHADKYSQAFSKNAKGGKYSKVSFADYEAGKYKNEDAWLYSSFWYKDFDGMALKTMFRQLISKYGVMSIEMQKAYEGDMTVNGTLPDADGVQTEAPMYFDSETGEAIE